LHFDSSDDLCRYVKEERGGRVLLSFSCGKDSIASWLQLRRFDIEVYPVYLYRIPGLDFVEKSLRYYETWFRTPILRMPHPSLYGWLNLFTFQAPERLALIDEFDPPRFDYDQVFDIARDAYRLGARSLMATGVRARDNPYRWSAVQKYGALNDNRWTFFPIFDWSKQQVIDAIRDAGVKLPIDYKLFGRSFDGLDWRFMKPLKEHLPDDYAKVVEWFPMVELEVKRIEWREAYYQREAERQQRLGAR
jgi:hypothetical protein